MAQHDYVIDNQTAPNFRSDLNNALAAIVSTNSGSSEPSTTYANMLWYDSTNNILKMRNEADDAWISVAYLDQSADAFRILDNTQVTTTAGSQTGLLGDQATATWEAGTGTTESLVSPAKVKAAIEALAPDPAIVTRTLIYNGTTNATVESSDFEDGYYYRFIFENVGTDGGNGDNYIALDFMRESDSTYVGTFGSTYLKVGYFNAGSPIQKTSGVVTVFAPRVSSNHFFAHGFFAAEQETTLFSGDADGQFAGGRVYVGATATKIKRIRFWGTDRITSSRDFVNGKIYQEKIKSV